MDGKIQENSYDGENMRAGLTEDGKSSIFLYHNGELLTECDGESAPIKRYLNGIRLSHVQTLADGIYHTYHQDEHGSTAYITEENRQVQNSYRGDGLNLYAYCANNPVMYYDPSGHKCEKTDSNKPEDTNAANVSPALKDSPYNPDVVDSRVKPDYVSNPAHDANSQLYNPNKTPEPSDAVNVYQNSVRGGMGEWYGVNESGDIYQFFMIMQVGRILLE